MKIKVFGIAPYRGLHDLLLELAQEDSRIELEVQIADLDEAVPYALRAEQEGYDVIVSRGGTASLIREHVSLPVVDIAVSGYDILRVLTLIKETNSRVAIIGFPNICQGVATISNLLDFEIPIYTIHHQSEARQALQQAIANNVQIVLGDVVTVRNAQELGYHGILIVSGRESCLEAFAEVKRVYELYNRGQEAARFYQQLLRHLPLGVLVVNRNGNVSYLNGVAEQNLGVLANQAQGQPLRLVAPELERLLAEAAVQQEKLVVPERERLLADVPVQQEKVEAETARVLVRGRWLNVQVAVNRASGDTESILYLQAAAAPNEMKKGTRQQPLRPETFAQIIGSSSILKATVERAQAFAKSERNVWITGSVGSGRTLFAKAIHAASARSGQPFTALNCTRPVEELDRLLFGSQDEPGLLKTADGTLFLTEVDRLPLALQERLWQAWEDGLSARLIVSSVKTCAELAETGEFAPGLLFGLSELHLHIPPLRARLEDIEDLVRVWMAVHNSQSGQQVVGLRPEVLQRLHQHDWPGNVKELKNVLAEMLALTKGHFVTEAEADAVWERYRDANESQPSVESSLDLSGSWEEIEQRILWQVLQEEGMNQSKAAKRLGLNRSTLWRKLRDHPLSR